MIADITKSNETSGINTMNKINKLKKITDDLITKIYNMVKYNIKYKIMQIQEFAQFA